MIPPTESQEQQAFIQWFRYKYPSILIFAIPNGGLRNVVIAKQLKAEGVVPGVPDLFIPAWKLFAEFKRQKGGRLSEAQKVVSEYLEGLPDGYVVLVCNGCDDGMEKVQEFKISGGKME